MYIDLDIIGRVDYQTPISSFGYRTMCYVADIILRNGKFHISTTMSGSPNLLRTVFLVRSILWAQQDVCFGHSQQQRCVCSCVRREGGWGSVFINLLIFETGNEFTTT